MGIDGFSLSNLGLNINKTSSKMASEADWLALQGNENQIKDIEGLSKKQKTAKKDKDSAFNGGYYLPEDIERKQVYEPEVSLDKEEEEIDETTFENYHFRLNHEHMIEVFDSETNEIIRVICPDDAARVLMNVSDVPGIIFNKKV